MIFKKPNIVEFEISGMKIRYETSELSFHKLKELALNDLLRMVRAGTGKKTQGQDREEEDEDEADEISIERNDDGKLVLRTPKRDDLYIHMYA